MIKYVVPKPVKKIKRTYTPIETERKKKKSWFRFFSIQVVWIIFWVFALFYGWFLLLRNTIFDTQYTIKRVIYDSGDIKRYDEPYMYKLITNRITDENYYVVKRYIKRMINDVTSQYPMVIDVAVDYRSTNTVFVKLTFRTIDLIINNQEQKFGIVGNSFFPVYSGNAIVNGVRDIYLPEYLSGLESLSWIFFRIPAETLVQQINMLYEWFPGFHHIEYLPGGDRSIVYKEWRKLYINNLGDIPNQIRNYELAKKYYKDFDTLAEIDLGSLEKDKIIVRKY